MHIEDYEKILDAVQDTGVYVIREIGRAHV